MIHFYKRFQINLVLPGPIVGLFVILRRRTRPSDQTRLQDIHQQQQGEKQFPGDLVTKGNEWTRGRVGGSWGQ